MSEDENRKITIRHAAEDDVALVLQFIRELAEYEKLGHEVIASEARLRDSLFGDKPEAEACLAFVDDQPAGFALFYENYSTFIGRKGIHLEDLFVRPEFRGLGLGRKLLVKVAAITRSRNCQRLTWQVLDWNESARQFYFGLDAEHLTDWQTFRLTDEALELLAAETEHDAS